VGEEDFAASREQILEIDETAARLNLAPGRSLACNVIAAGICL
jgi:hypothetical protein